MTDIRDQYEKAAIVFAAAIGATVLAFVLVLIAVAIVVVSNIITK